MSHSVSNSLRNFPQNSTYNQLLHRDMWAHSLSDTLKKIKSIHANFKAEEVVKQASDILRKYQIPQTTEQCSSDIVVIGNLSKSSAERIHEASLYNFTTRMASLSMIGDSILENRIPQKLTNFSFNGTNLCSSFDALSLETVKKDPTLEVIKKEIRLLKELKTEASLDLVNKGLKNIKSTLLVASFLSELRQEDTITLPSEIITTMEETLTHPVIFKRVVATEDTCLIFEISINNKPYGLKIYTHYDIDLWEEEICHTLYFSIHPHKHLVRTQGFITEVCGAPKVTSSAISEYMMLLPLCSIDLERLLTKNYKQFTSPQIRNYALQAAEAFKHMHDLNVTHSDVKLENIMLFLDICLVIDVGFATDLKRLILNKNIFKGTHSCLAPEFGPYFAPGLGKDFTTELVNDPIINRKACDIWAFGISLFTLVTNEGFFCITIPSRMPKDEIHEYYVGIVLEAGQEIESHLKKHFENPDILKSFKRLDPHGLLEKIIRGCLKLNPDDRLSFEEIVKILKGDEV